MKAVALIRVRGQLDVRPKNKKALEILGLTKKHACRVMKWNPTTRGQVRRVKDFIAWGEVSEEALTKLLEKEGVQDAGEKAEEFINGKGQLTQKVFNLKPPQRGFPRGGVRQPTALGGAIGFYKDINELIMRMI